ncbi:hypothetical protein [Paraglaciecola aestuariivivens]
MTDLKINQRAFFYTCFIAFVCGLAISYLATNGTFNLFQPSFLWKAYNHYFLSLIDGRLDVPAFAIGKEGSFINGKAYMYYGILPTVPRLLLFPFVDLTQVPVSYFVVLFFTILGNSVLQYSLLAKYMSLKLSQGSKSKHTPSLALFIVVSAIVWIGSGCFIISQNATLYHEPYAASLCLVNLFLALLVKNDFFTGDYRKVNLIPFSVVAGLCIHARMPSALALYLVTGIIILVQTYRSQLEHNVKPNFYRLIVQSITQHWPSILVLGAFGVSILWLNYVKYGDVFSFMGKNYGFRFFEGLSERVCSVIPHAYFYKFYRILVNGYIYLSGDWQSHWSLIRLFSTGYGRVELPVVPLLVLWALPVSTMVFLLFTFLKGLRQVTNRLLLIAFLCFSAGAIFQLMYPTISHRYVVTLWPPLLASVLYCWFKYSHVINSTIKLLVITLGSLGIAYQLYLALYEDYYINDGPVTSKLLPTFHYSESDNAYLESLTPEKIDAFNEELKAKRAAECAKFK